MRAHIEQTPTAVVALLVLGVTAWFGLLNVTNASNLAPQWSQDLAFFHQWVHSAANGGPWASPLILEPQGFFAQVHTHFILAPVVGLYKLWPDQDLLLILHSFFVSITIWPAFRLAEGIGGGRHAFLCMAALVLFGPFQALAIADFRPVVLLMPSIVGVWYGAWRGSMPIALAWAVVGILGRQEAAYLLLFSGMVMAISKWGRSSRTIAIALIGLGVSSWTMFFVLKPEMFFHINPFAPSAPWPDSPELWDNRFLFATTLLLSGWSLGLLSPIPLLAAAPIIWGFLSSSREWHALFGPGAHHHVFWLPFVVVAGVAGASKIPKSLGPLLLLIGSSMTFNKNLEQRGEVGLLALIEQIPAEAPVAADYDTIHRLSGRKVLWNVDQLYMEDRPWHWRETWPITADEVEWIIMPIAHPVQRHVGSWEVVDSRENHVLLRRR